MQGQKLKNFDRLHAWLDESLRLCRESELFELMPEAMWTVGLIAWYEGEFDRMSKRFEEVEVILEGVEMTPRMNSMMAQTRRSQGVSICHARRQSTGHRTLRGCTGTGP